MNPGIKQKGSGNKNNEFRNKKIDLGKILTLKKENDTARNVVHTFILSELNNGLADCVGWKPKTTHFENILQKFQKERDVLNKEIQKLQN